MKLDKCPIPDMLRDYATGKLKEDVSIAIDEHVSECPDCQALIGTVDDADDTLLNCMRGAFEKDEYEQEDAYQHAVANIKGLVGGNSAGNDSPDNLAGEPPTLNKLGEYTLLAKLGQGGMGAVYRARQANLDRIVALKVLPKGRLEDQQAVSRFYREMQAVGRLNHPNIVQAYDARNIDGIPILAMEYVPGLDLSELVKRAGQLNIADACELIRQAAVGLQYAHENDLVHRDVKPSNLMLAAGGTVKILDLGLALLDSGELNGGEVTGSGQAMGTADYMAPEQTFDSHQVDIRADIYGLGCTLYKLLTSHTPFTGPKHATNMAKMMAHVQEPAPAIRERRPEVSDELAAIVERMMAKEPDDRFATPGEVAVALEPFASVCDLSELVARVGEQSQPPANGDMTLGSTEEFLRSALTDTRPSHPRQPAPLRARRWSRPLAIGVALAGIVLLGVVLTLTGRYGTLVIDADDPQVQIAVKQGGEQVEILNAESGWAIRLKSGKYDVELNGDQDRFEIDRDSVTVRRGDRVTVKVTLKRPSLTGEESPGDKSGGPFTAAPLGVEPEPRDIQPGEPLSGSALVSRPASLPGVKSWTLETVGHRSIVQCVTYSPDGKWIGSAGHDGSIRLFSAATTELVRILVGHAGAVSALCWSPDGGVLASASQDETIRFWDPESGQLLRTIRPPSGGLKVMAWSPDGKTLAYNASRMQIGLWDVEANRPTKAFGHVEGALIWSPDGKTLATWIRDQRIQLWDVESGTPGHTLVAQSGAAQLAWSPDGQLLAASGTYANTVRLWEARTGEVLRDLTAAGFSMPFLAFSHDGKILAVSATRYTNSGMILRWEVPTFDPLPPVPTGFAWRPGSMAWSPDGSRIVVGDWTGSVKIVDVAAQQLVRTHTGYQGYRSIGDVGLAWSPTGKELAVASCMSGWGLSVLSAVDGGSDARFTDAGQADEVAWSPDGSMLAFENTGSVGIVSADLYERLGGFDVQRADESILAWSPDGKRLARCAIDGRQQNVQLYDASSKTVLELGEHQHGICSMAWSPDGKLVATGGRDDKILLFDANSGTLARELDGHSGTILHLAWSADGSLLASASNQQTIRIWTVADGKSVTKIVRDTPTALAFSRDHRYFACGTETTGKIGCIVWNLDSGETVHRLDCHRPKLLDFSSDGQHLTAIGADGTLRRWDLASGKLAAERRSHPSQSLLTEWSPDHKLVADFACGMGIHFWRFESGEPLAAMVILGEEVLRVIPSGHYHATPGLDVANELVFVVQTDQGQELLPPQEFAQQYGWRNDPDKVSLLLKDSI